MKDFNYLIGLYFRGNFVAYKSPSNCLKIPKNDVTIEKLFSLRTYNHILIPLDTMHFGIPK